jgi:hypothetical protein
MSFNSITAACLEIASCRHSTRTPVATVAAFPQALTPTEDAGMLEHGNGPQPEKDAGR